MREIAAFEAKNKFGQLLDRVEHGEEITITRHGKEIARLVPAGVASTARKPVRRAPHPRAQSCLSSAVSIGPNGRPFALRAGHEFSA